MTDPGFFPVSWSSDGRQGTDAPAASPGSGFHVVRLVARATSPKGWRCGSKDTLCSLLSRSWVSSLCRQLLAGRAPQAWRDTARWLWPLSNQAGPAGRRSSPSSWPGSAASWAGPAAWRGRFRVGGACAAPRLSLGPAACVCATLASHPVVQVGLFGVICSDLSCGPVGQSSLNKSCPLLSPPRPPQPTRRQRTPSQPRETRAASCQWVLRRAGQNGVALLQGRVSPASRVTRVLRADAGCVLRAGGPTP